MSAIEKVTSSMAAVSLSDGPVEEESKVILICRDRKEAKVILVCSDGKEIYMDNDTALMSAYLSMRIWLFRSCYGNGTDRVKIKLYAFEEVAHIPSYLVEKAFRYCHAHAQPHDDLEAFDNFFMDVDYTELCRLLKTAIWFDIDGLRKLATVAYKNRTGKSPYVHCEDLFRKFV